MNLYEEIEIEIQDFFAMAEKEEGIYEIDTPDGWQEIGSLIKKNKKECYILRMSNGIELGCSSEHLVLTENGWKKTKDLDVQFDSVLSKNGSTSLIAKEYVGIKNTYDLEVLHENHRYYSNSIISHNCGKSLTAKATASAYNMPLLRLDFGKMFNSLVGESEKIARHAIKLAETVAPCVSGESIVYDDNGKSYKIKDLVENGNGDKPMYTYSLNEKTWKLEKTKVKAVIKHAEKKKMLRISSSTGSIDVTEDHKMMVNREGNLLWVESKDLTKSDVLVVSKTLVRTQKILNIREIFPNKKDKNITLRSGGKMHSADVSVSLISLMHLAVISGMIDSSGSCNEETGDILFSHANISILHFLASMMSEAFLTEPHVGKDFVKLNNKVVAKMISHFLDNVGSQNEEIIGCYLGGHFHASGIFGFVDKDEDPSRKPYVQFSILTEGVFDRIRKSLLVYGIISFKSLKTMIIIDNNHIETFFQKVPILTKKRAVEVNNFINHIEKYPPKSINMFGYKFGKSLLSLKSDFGITDEKYDSISMFEESNAVMQYDVASYLNREIKKNRKEKIDCPITKLVESDIVCVKIYSIDSVEEQWAYDLSCEGNNNFFANGFLCHNCILWADEIEKGLAGGVGSGSGDSGTTKRVIGTFLTWLQEKTAPVFVICTANNVQDIPPEFMRAGRFDEVFFVDLPSSKGREQIFKVLLKKFKYDPNLFDIKELCLYTKNYSGAEIEKAIENAMFECFCDNKKEMQTIDLVLSCRSITPLSETRDKEFQEMRTWAKTRCKFANTEEYGGNEKVNKKEIVDLDFNQ